MALLLDTRSIRSGVSFAVLVSMADLIAELGHDLLCLRLCWRAGLAQAGRGSRNGQLAVASQSHAAHQRGAVPG